MVEGANRPAWAEIDLGAVRRNVRLLRAIASPAPVCAVVKADAYGHGAVEVARAALAAGATEIGVAIVDEGIELREAGIEAPILLLSEPSGDAMDETVRRRLTPTIYSFAGMSLLASAVRAVRPRLPIAVEVKLDTGMHRVGIDAGDLAGLVGALQSKPELALAGLWTHLAVADEPENPFTAEQLRRLAAGRAALAGAGLPTGRRMHAANSAGAIAWPEARLDLVRCGIAIYGYAPSTALAPVVEAEARRVAGRLGDKDRPAAGVAGVGPRADDVEGRRAGEEPPAGVGPRADDVEGRQAGEEPPAGESSRDDEAAERRPAALEPALALKARVSFVRELPAGERISYGLRAPLPSAALVATVPLGYCDGIPRAYFDAGGEVLLNGRRCRLAGTVTMDQIVVDCGEDQSVRPGDEVVLIGAQGKERITADDWAAALGTVSYEIVTRIGPRVSRLYRDDGVAPPRRAK